MRLSLKLKTVAALFLISLCANAQQPGIKVSGLPPDPHQPGPQDITIIDYWDGFTYKTFSTTISNMLSNLNLYPPGIGSSTTNASTNVIYYIVTTFNGPTNKITLNNTFWNYTTTNQNVAITNVDNIQPGIATWATLNVSNSGPGNIVGYVTVPFARAIGIQTTPAMTIPANKVGMWSFLSVGGLVTNYVAAVQDATAQFTINNIITTNLTIQFPGGFTNLNLTPRTVMYADVNDAESSVPNAAGVLTNDSTGGVGFNTKLQLDEVDALLFYPTNLFTGLTNYSVLGTDGNGLLTLGSSTITNITITNAYIQNLTNNNFYNTNLFISTSNAFLNFTTVTNLNATNLYFISGKGNTLIITNNLNLQYLSNSKLVATDGAKNLTNADVSADLTFSGNVLGLGTKGTAGTYTKTTFDANGRETSGTSAILASADFANQGTTTTVLHGNAAGNPSFGQVVAADISAGISPTLNLVNSTNLIYRYTTNALTGIVMTFGQAFMTNVSTANITFTAINAQDLAALETCCLFATNSSGSDHTITFPAGIAGPGLGAPPVITVTNKQSCWIYVQHYGNQATNCWFIPSY